MLRQGSPMTSGLFSQRQVPTPMPILGGQPKPKRSQRDRQLTTRHLFGNISGRHGSHGNFAKMRAPAQKTEFMLCPSLVIDPFFNFYNLRHFRTGKIKSIQSHGNPPAISISNRDLKSAWIEIPLNFFNILILQFCRTQWRESSLVHPRHTEQSRAIDKSSQDKQDLLIASLKFVSVILTV